MSPLAEAIRPQREGAGADMVRASRKLATLNGANPVRSTLGAVAFPMVIIDRDFDESGARELIAQVRRVRCEHGVFVLMLCEVDCDGAATDVCQAAGVDYCLGRRSADERIKSTLREVRAVLNLRHVSANH